MFAVISPLTLAADHGHVHKQESEIEYENQLRQRGYAMR